MQKLLILLSLTFFLSYAAHSNHTLQFNKQGEFVIVQFTDLHFCMNTTIDLKTQALQKAILEKVKPDFVAISGDGISGGFVHKKKGGFEKCWKSMLAPIVDANIPYAYTLGNHDGEGDLDRFHIAKLEETHPLSVRKGTEGIPNTLNFVVPVYSSQNKTKLTANVWVFDTNYVGCDGLENSWGCIEKYQLDWYDRQSKKIKNKHGKDVHHIAFLHIPIPEYMEMYNNGEFYGEMNEGVGCPDINTGFFERVKKNGDISAMFVGHDHTNNMGGFYKGVELVYGQKSGHNSSGKIRGARVIVLKENYTKEGKLYVTRKHYVVLESGEVVENGPLKRRKGNAQTCKIPGGPDSPFVMKMKKLFYTTKHAIRH